MIEKFQQACVVVVVCIFIARLFVFAYLLYCDQSLCERVVHNEADL